MDFHYLSTRHARLSGWTGRVACDIEVDEEKIQLKIKPKSLNNIPVIRLEDITDIQITSKIGFVHILYALIALVGCFFGQIYLLFAVIWFLYCGWNRKVTIYIYNGASTYFYTSNKVDAENFREYMEQVTNIPKKEK